MAIKIPIEPTLFCVIYRTFGCELVILFPFSLVSHVLYSKKKTEETLSHIKIFGMCIYRFLFIMSFDVSVMI